jgi:beta-glucosidase-like glycosyl hydrolase
MRDSHSLEKRCFQLIIGRLDGDMLLSAEYTDTIVDLVRKGIGGFILFGGERDEVSDFIAMLQSIADIPLFIASDIERGVGHQVTRTTTFPCQMAVAAATAREHQEDITTLERMVRAIAEEAADVGINMPLIPVMDVNLNPDNPIICTRAFSDDPDVVGRLGCRYISLLESGGLISCAKHFPGHGDTATDSHLSLPEIRKSLDELMATDLPPFKAAIAAGVSCIMVGHLQVSALDMCAATVSVKVMRGLLRDTLGYQGLIMTDAVNMGALSEVHDAATACINAGADIVLHPRNAEETARGLVAALDSARLSEGQIDEAFQRILTVKNRLKSTERADRTQVDYRRHALLSQQVTERAVTLVKNQEGVLPLSGQHRIALVLVGPEKICHASPLPRLIANVTRTIRLTPESGSNQDFPDIEGEVLLVAIFTQVSAWKGSSGIRDEERVRIDRILRRAASSIVVSFGSPYVLRHFSDAPAAIACYDTTPEAQQAVAQAMYGLTAFTGSLPVTLSH